MVDPYQFGYPLECTKCKNLCQGDGGCDTQSNSNRQSLWGIAPLLLARL